MDVACTIIARNYLGQAQLLAASFRKIHPDRLFVCLVADADATSNVQWTRPMLAADEMCELRTPSSLDIEESVLAAMAYMYDVIEYCTSLKPALLASLLAVAGANGTVTYIDPDMLVYATLPTVNAYGTDFVASITPHRLTPPPAGGRADAEVLFMRNGAFNLGYISCNATATEFLDWWHERLITDAIISPREALFTDQKWIDLATTYFPILQERDPGVNVAWWNSDERHLSVRADGCHAGDGPLRLAHFSGLKPDHATPPSGILAASNCSSDQIFLDKARDYLRSLQEEQQLAGLGPVYGFESTRDGRQITKYERRKFRNHFRAALRKQDILPEAPWHAPRSRSGLVLEAAMSRVDRIVGSELSWEFLLPKFRSFIKRRRV